ncbi:excalibur calcium-binding domain-containing protein [Nocardia otitidiscaviarum]|uniref:Excalibur calcium-binding domain n=1 Tax=Nocardia otitidiscaviarum TaxID=1823 RepID=A0A378YKV9_9NOCA|nr:MULTISPECIES: excalibur calcium-binding domain-containing protein [Nocardia]MBF6133259.1 excalibur calcium-binding domain-containing protein [Nocardia otitidiscaviarum]MBF6181740.1 excalibur calcium-binding domain-containing protein [Nocardia otitidiscaviarum]MBF6240985.1 excalibur calcium-binding domain-containing protein [Nocardia otitidiscaviarum]MBF6486655.1 excalibur calcium-binding domain-containing protein [Nocardia otitidiscaviarum]MCP9620478.1 excalibur calcium-binding domain-conta
MNVRRLLVTASVAGLTTLAPAAAAVAQVPAGSSGTGSSTIDTGSAAVGSAQLSQTGSAGGSYRNCDDARAAGHAPLFRGEPGYGPHLDPDGDGFACPTV